LRYESDEIERRRSNDALVCATHNGCGSGLAITQCGNADLTPGLRIDEIRAASLVRLGRLDEAELTIARVLKELVNEDIEGFLPSPIELLYALVDTASVQHSEEANGAREIIRRFAMQLPVESWFGDELANRIKAISEERP
jgi:hypothetical protein